MKWVVFLIWCVLLVLAARAIAYRSDFYKFVVASVFAVALALIEVV